MSISVVRELSESEWGRFAAGRTEGNIFHTPEMFEVFRRTKDFRPELWAAVEDGEILALLLPVRISLLNNLVGRGLTTRSIVFGSVLAVPGGRGREALARLLEVYARDVRPRPLFTELRNLADLGDLQPSLTGAGFSYNEHLNYLIDLGPSPEELFNRIGQRTRKNIRHALNRKRVQVEEVSRREEIAACYALLVKTYGRASVPIADLSLFEAAFDVLGPKKMIRFSLARVGTTPAAVSVELLYKDLIYGWYGGVDREYRAASANEVLTWDILRWGSENGFRTYDFGGAGEPGKSYGVRDFKAKFGGMLVNFGRNTLVHAPVRYHLSKTAYSLLQPVLFGFFAQKRRLKKRGVSPEQP